MCGYCHRTGSICLARKTFAFWKFLCLFPSQVAPCVLLLTLSMVSIECHLYRKELRGGKSRIQGYENEKWVKWVAGLGLPSHDPHSQAWMICTYLAAWLAQSQGAPHLTSLLANSLLGLSDNSIALGSSVWDMWWDEVSKSHLFQNYWPIACLWATRPVRRVSKVLLARKAPLSEQLTIMIFFLQFCAWPQKTISLFPLLVPQPGQSYQDPRTRNNICFHLTASE